ncbi:MAG: hypothetical protein CM15mP103_13220 [Gammaproteobacteria bacterium]|nr:MAG: hypothetical protein CM15mP103_13220 [Gammaproteobacteria bacterium]
MGWGFSPLGDTGIVDYGDCDFDAGNPAGVPDELRVPRQILLPILCCYRLGATILCLTHCSEQR